MEIFVWVLIFIAVLLLIEGGYFALRSLQNPEKKRIRMRLRALSSGDYEAPSIDIVKKDILSEVPWLNRVLLSLRWTSQLRRLLEQSGIERPLGLFILVSALLVIGGLLIGSWLSLNVLILILVAAFLGSLPFFYIYLKKNQRMKKFERQLPDAMDLMARALRAGHAFSGGLKLVADELDDPIATEFSKTMNEINFGISVNQALKNLADRVDCSDLKFFVLSVILQRETGGNLAEILESIAYLIRERFKLHGRIRVLSAEGRFSALVLVALPFVVAFVISFLNPGYIGTLIGDPIGKILIIFAILMMIFGILTMRRMVQIKV